MVSPKAYRPGLNPHLQRVRQTRRGKEAKLSFMGYVLMKNRNGLIVGTRASGHAERLAALHLAEPHADPQQKVTLAGDKGYEGDFVAELREINATPHVAQNTNGRRSVIDGRTTCHPGSAVSLRIRRRIKEALVRPRRWPGCARRAIRGLAKVDGQFTFTTAAYNLIRLPKLLVAAA